MLTACKARIKQALVAQGIVDRNVCMNAGQAGQMRAKPYAVLHITSDESEFDGSLVSTTADPATRTVTKLRRRYRRTIQLGVALIDKNETLCDGRAEQLLAGLPRGFIDADGHYIALSPGRAKWSEDEGFVLDETRAELTLTFAGGIYVTETAPLVDASTAVRIDATLVPQGA